MAKYLPKVTKCQNCGTTIDIAYCPQCGQEGVQHTASLKELFAELADSLFNVHSKLARTLYCLICKPGHLTNAYVTGRRVCYLSPLRVYLIFSLIFFLSLGNPLSNVQTKGVKVNFKEGDGSIVQISGNNDEKKESAKGSKTPSNEPAIVVPDDGGWAISIKNIEKLPETLTEAEKRVPEGKRLTPFQRYLLGRIVTFKKGGVELFLLKMYEYLPNTMFLLLPLFAFALKLLYLRSKRRYIEHLIFLFHCHSFVFVVWTLQNLLNLGWVESILQLVQLGYLTLSLKTVYKQPWWKTIVKMLMLMACYGFILLITLFLTIILTFATA